MKNIILPLFAFTFATFAADNWPQWRGPNGDGIAAGEKVPATWSDTKNLKWKLKLPGAGASSPVVWGDRVFLTCYSGYGTGGDGSTRDLMRHVVCVDAKSGKKIWQKDFASTVEVDRYGGMGVPEHGYATGTPATDGKSVFVFFGSSGLLALDLAGKKLWQTDVGKNTSRKRWGSAASPVVHGDFVYLNALREGHKIFALNKATGKVAWSWGPNQYDFYQDTYGNPALVKTESGTELVLAVNYQVWAFDAAKGGIKWFADTDVGGSNISPSILAAGGRLFAFGGRPASGAALRAGGKDDVSKTHLDWASSRSPYVPSPVHHAGHLYWMDRSGYAICLSAKTGKEVFRERLKSTGRAAQFYASPVLVDGKVISVSRNAGAFVIEAKPKFNQLTQNIFASDRSVFNASPAIANGRIFLRSDTHLYCVGK